MRARTQLVLLAVAALALSACGDGQLIDASGENGGGGLAFVAMCIMIFVFVGSLFFLDKVRSRHMDE